MSHQEDLTPVDITWHQPIFKRCIVVPTTVATLYGLALGYGFMLLATITWVIAYFSLCALCVAILLTIVVHSDRQQALSRLENGADLIGMVLTTWQEECGYFWLHLRTVRVWRLVAGTLLLAGGVTLSVAHGHVI